YLRSDVDYRFVDLRYWQPDASDREIEVVVHLAALGGVSRAAREPVNILDANCRGTARLAAATRNWPGLRKIILGSSFSVYGANYAYRCKSCGAEASGERDPERLDRGQFEVICRRCDAEMAILPITEEATPSPLETYGVSKYMQELCFRGLTH